ncbi:hypothetical protein F441_05402 [Phytophthora nicotianae CJ01A1]|uniref:Uncharacterized protein n=6 Tax=Phytophthora nicotianae TaxID=4792 RepID=W2QGA2_PHYN3|nr:hypothetical protein PPTG_09569 [Phytophthora nicotianae INRA-310]ETI51194.1 hypothetical protein F443_05395 [Phytophthora nicotianae P1569]ETK91111.1 hypothetical protein L915_05252 [Phytophthora nicotianae]ETO79936.1 hypothetical protein F444_05440 [Phytophthora nicotianae P1976]ETP20957.1 hypothetical protein F441_05402 [Phytophthora nicotianae CJ01A1]ETP48911.1 hypothetical protein F442_05445 [Phytophthora nicotianae P10297]
MSEDEFVVLLEHAGILETSDENDMEFMEETVLREWLERDGVQLFTTQMTAAKRDQSDSDLVVDGSASTAPTATATATTLVGEARTRMAGHILARLLERGWIAPIEFDYDEDETEEWKTKLYTPRLRTNEAYRIYIEKDPTATQLTARGFHLRAHELRTAGLSTEQDGTEMPPPIPVSVADNDMKSRLREKMWQDCFPTCSESAKQTFLSFTRPEIILYATLGLNLISNGISSVPAFSRELKSMGVTSADDRSIIVGFLAKAFPTE